MNEPGSTLGAHVIEKVRFQASKEGSCLTGVFSVPGMWHLARWEAPSSHD